MNSGRLDFTIKLTFNKKEIRADTHL